MSHLPLVSLPEVPKPNRVLLSGPIRPPWRFLVDEDMARSTATALRTMGYEADDVRDIGLRGRSDPEVLAEAQMRGAVLVTADKGFANTLDYPLGTHGGIVVVRVPDELPTATIHQELLRTLREIEGDDLIGTLVIVEIGRVRIRRPPR